MAGSRIGGIEIGQRRTASVAGMRSARSPTLRFPDDGSAPIAAEGDATEARLTALLATTSDEELLALPPLEE